MRIKPKRTEKLRLFAVLALACVFCALLAPTAAFADELSDSPVLLLDKGAQEGNKVEIIATLAKNSGIFNVLLVLDYDDSALKLAEVTEGTALGDLSCVRSGTLSTKPYKLHYLGNYLENSYSTGVLARFVFEIKEGAADGVYKITLKADGDVEYFDADTMKTKNLVSDSATVTVKGSDTTVEVIPGEEPEPNDDKLLVILLPVCAVVIVAAAITVIFVIKQGRSR